jgi:ferrous iron transport protein A
MRNLFDLETGEKCLIDKILCCSNIKRRLMDIGLIEDTVVECVNKSPQGDPKAFLIRGAVIALRQSDCQNILVKDLVL